MVGSYFSVTIRGLVMLIQKTLKLFENMENHEMLYPNTLLRKQMRVWICYVKMEL